MQEKWHCANFFKNCSCRLAANAKIYLENGVKFLEKSWNFVVAEKWEPCFNLKSECRIMLRGIYNPFIWSFKSKFKAITKLTTGQEFKFMGPCDLRPKFASTHAPDPPN